MLYPRIVRVGDTDKLVADYGLADKVLKPGIWSNWIE